MMIDIQRKRALFQLADVVIGLASAFLLLDAMTGFTGHGQVPAVQSQPVSLDINSANLSTACSGGFSNEQTINGVTEVASRGTPFNAYRMTLTNISAISLTVRSVNVELIDTRNRIFTQHFTDLGRGSGITLLPGQARQIVEAYGIGHPVAACEVLSWQS